MRTERFKNLVEGGRYSPDPGVVAEAMLRHRGVRTLLATGLALRQADRSRQVAAAPTRRAA